MQGISGPQRIPPNRTERNQLQSLEDMYDPVKKVHAFGTGHVLGMTPNSEEVMLFPPPTTMRRRRRMDLKFLSIG